MVGSGHPRLRGVLGVIDPRWAEDRPEHPMALHPRVAEGRTRQRCGHRSRQLHSQDQGHPPPERTRSKERTAERITRPHSKSHRTLSAHPGPEDRTPPPHHHVSGLRLGPQRHNKRMHTNSPPVFSRPNLASQPSYLRPSRVPWR